VGLVTEWPGKATKQLVLFTSNVLLVLSTSERLSMFVFENKFDINKLAVQSLDDSPVCQNAFELRGPDTCFVAVCQSVAERNKWIAKLRQNSDDTKLLSEGKSDGKIGNPTRSETNQPMKKQESKPDRNRKLFCIRPHSPMRNDFSDISQRKEALSANEELELLAIIDSFHVNTSKVKPVVQLHRANTSIESELRSKSNGNVDDESVRYLTQRPNHPLSTIEEEEKRNTVDNELILRSVQSVQQLFSEMKDELSLLNNRTIQLSQDIETERCNRIQTQILRH